MSERSSRNGKAGVGKVRLDPLLIEDKETQGEKGVDITGKVECETRPRDLVIH